MCAMNIIIGLLATFIVLTNLLVIAVCIFSGMLDERETTAARPPRRALIHVGQSPVERSVAPGRPATPELLSHRNLAPAG